MKFKQITPLRRLKFKVRLFFQRIPYNVHLAYWIAHTFVTQNKCEHAHYQHITARCEGEVKMRGAMTAYHFEGTPNSKEDPNKSFLACKAHHDEYVDHWTDMWSNVPRG